MFERPPFGKERVQTPRLSPTEPEVKAANESTRGEEQLAYRLGNT